MNEAIEQIVNDHHGNPEVLKQALLARDEEILDQLRLAAAQNGLAPAMIAVNLMQIGLGDKPSDEQVAHLVGAAQAEQEAMHQRFHEMTGTECQCTRPESPGQS